jgi:hypothetical protein
MGGVLVALGVGMAWFQSRFRQPNPAEDELTQSHDARRLRRRLQVSGLLILAGVLIPLGDMLPFFRKSPVAFTLFWLAILGLVCWIMLLALGDFAAARAYHNLANLRLRQGRRELERQIERYRASGNGHATTSDEEG